MRPKGIGTKDSCLWLLLAFLCLALAVACQHGTVGKGDADGVQDADGSGDGGLDAEAGGDPDGGFDADYPADPDTGGDSDPDTDGAADLDDVADGGLEPDAGNDAAGGDADGGGGIVECHDNCHCVRAAASGNRTGTDWTNAMTDLPGNLIRGHIYLVAAGSYGAYRFDDAADGTTPILVIKATSGAHGTDVGWQPAYADGQAVFGELRFTAPYGVFDGGPGTGIRAVAGFQGTCVSIESHHVAVRNVDMDGNFAENGGQQTDGACTGLEISGDDHVVEGCEIHDAADDGVSIAGVRRLRFAGNRVHGLHACGTDNGCGPCYNGHSDGLELYDAEDSLISGNLVYDINSTAAVFFGNWADELGNGAADYCLNITLVNNIFYTPETGFAVYFQDVDGLVAYHNVIWGLHQGRYGGLAIGDNTTDLEMVNNVILSINYEHIGATYDPDEHRGHHNLFGVSLGQYTEQPGDIVDPDPGFEGLPDMDGPAVNNPLPDDFMLRADSPCLNAGSPDETTLPLPDVDFRGQPRDEQPDIGAMEPAF